jgi:hypothetical protein
VTVSCHPQKMLVASPGRPVLQRLSRFLHPVSEET